MQSNTSAEQDTKAIKPKTFQKQSTTLRMNYNTHCQQQSLMDMAEAFRQAYCQTTTTRGLQKSLIDEEWSEFHEAFFMKPEYEQLKELADLVYVCYQFAASQEWDLDEAMKRVHESNMSKLDEYGKPIYRPDGKILKGPNYAPPNLEDLV